MAKAMKTKKGGRSVGSHGYTRKQLDIIKDAHSRNLGRRAIMRQYPNEQFTEGGVAAALDRIKKTGTVDPPRRKRPQTKLTKAKIAAVKKILEDDPKVSLTEIGKMAKLKKGTVYNAVAKNLSLKAARPIKGQHLDDRKKRNRLDFCKKTLVKLKSGTLPLKRIFFTDEKMFKVKDCAKENTQNKRAWVDKKLKKRDISPDVLILGKKARGVQIMVGLAASYRGLITPFFVQPGEKITGDYYQEMLSNSYLPQMCRMYGNAVGFWLQEDGAPAHTKKTVAQFKKLNFPNRIENWPASSPDLSPLDFSIWSQLEARVWAKDPKTLVELKCAILEACEQLPLKNVKKSIKAFKKRVRMCVDAEGGFFEYKK